MATINIACGANISSAVSGGAAGDTYQFAPGIYYGQNFVNQLPTDVYLGDSSGLTILSGAWLVTSWSGSGSTWAATQGISDLNGTTQTNFPVTDSIFSTLTASFNTTGGTSGGTAYLGQMIVTGSPTQPLTVGSCVWNEAGTVPSGQQILVQVSGTAGAAGTYGVSLAHTVASGTVFMTQCAGQITTTSLMANFAEQLYVNGTRYTRIATPGPAGANTWWFNGTSKSINVNTNLGASTGTGSSCSIAGNVLTVGGTVTGTFTPFQSVIAGTGVTVGTQIIAYGTGTGGAGTYIINYSQTVAARAMTAQPVVEFTIAPYLNFDSGSNFGVTFQNIVVEKYVPDTSGAPVGTHLWNYYGCTFRYNYGAGLGIGAGCVVKNCKLNSNAQLGYISSQGDNFQIIDSEIAGNNWAGFDPFWEAGGGKAAVTNNTVVSGCKVHDNLGVGIWWDVSCNGAVITDNLVYNNLANGWGTPGSYGANGIMYEISKGNVRISNNVVFGNDAAGIFVSNSGDPLGIIEVYGNIITVGASNTGGFVVPNGGISAINDGRGADGNNIPYELRSLNVHNNIIIHTTDAALDGFYVYQALTGPNITWDYNTYITPNATGTYWEFDNLNGSAGGSGTFTWATLQTAGVYEVHGANLVGAPKTWAQVMALISAPGAGTINKLNIQTLFLTLLASAPFPQAPI